MNLPNEQRPIVETADYIVGGKLPAHISEDIFVQVADAFNHDKNIIDVPANELADSFYAGLGLIVLNPEGKAIGYTRLLLIVEVDGQPWFELGSTWVHEDYRNQGLITVSYRKLLAQHEDKNILAASSTKAAIAVGKKLGFVFVARRNLPELVWRACCICPKEKTDVDDNNVCLRAYGESQQTGPICFTRVTKTTAERYKLAVIVDADKQQT